MGWFAVRLRLLLALAAMFWLVGPAFAVQATLVADAHVNSAASAVNSGSISNLFVGAGYTALLQFDLGVLPSGTTAAQVSKAVLRVYCNRVDTPGPLSVQPVGAPWGEYSVTYTTLPTLSAAVQVVTVAQVGGYVAVDVTALVQGWVTAPATNFGLALTSGTAAVQFDSKENDLTGHAAELEVTLISQGPAGAVGPQGTQGLAGAAGAVGPQGPKGDTGAIGPQGPAGPAGSSSAAALGSYRGTYSSVTNYGTGDVVVSQGSSYTSLIASNAGNAPGLNPAAWGVLALGATGTPGPQGPQGVAGPAGLMGPQGIPGAAGARGLTGAAGPQGSAGAPGLQGPQGVPGAPGPAVVNYLGNYVTSSNYALHDAVSFGGSTYVSLVAGNVGNTPGLSPAQWAVLAAQGAIGPSGVNGTVGPAGPAGASGAAGPQGPQGPPVTFAGGWLAGTGYTLGDVVGYAGSSYVALTGNGNIARQPDVSPLYWGLLAQVGAAGPAGATGPQGFQGPTGFAGATGATGPAGPQGAVGATGPMGPQGLAGPAGPAGSTGATGAAELSYKGAYSAVVNYGLNEAVTYLGSSYISLVTGNIGNAPSLSPSQWSLLAAQGAVGPAGLPGVQGAQGPAGVNGAPGAAGPQGVGGQPGVVYRGPWNAGILYALGDAVMFSGTSYIATASTIGLEPDLFPAAWGVLAAQGGPGATGPSGAAATVTIGTVTTGLAGTQASVSNAGTPSAAILNFTIPQGMAGTNGSGGGGGASASTVLSMYHPVSFQTSFYSVSNPNASPTEAALVLTWVPAACTATSLTVFSQQSNAVRVTLRNGILGSISDTPLACVATANGSCTVTGSVPLAAGSFVDLSISGANGTPMGVWTAVECS